MTDKPPTPKRHMTGRDVTAPKGHCRWCKEPVQPPRRTWCSQECVDQYLIRASAERARAAVWERDQGICQGCQLDLKPLHEMSPISFYPPTEPGKPWRHTTKRHEEARRLGLIGPDQPARNSYWEADHIVPVVEGGGACGLENLRVLCLRCHRAETAALARRRAEARRPPEPPQPAPQPVPQLSLFGVDGSS